MRQTEQTIVWGCEPVKRLLKVGCDKGTGLRRHESLPSFNIMRAGHLCTLINSVSILDQTYLQDRGHPADRTPKTLRIFSFIAP